MSKLRSRRATCVRQLGQEFAGRWAILCAKRDRGFGRRGVARADARMLARLDGTRPGMRTLTGSNGVGRRTLVAQLLRDLMPVFRADPSLEWLHVTVIVDEWATGDEGTTIDLGAIHTQASGILDLMTPDWLATIETQVFTNMKHLDGGKRLSPHVHAVAWGHDISASASALVEELNAQLSAGTPGCDAIRVQLIGPTRMDLARVVRYAHKAPDRCKTLYYNPRERRWDIHESEKGDRYVRYLRLMRILSVIPQRDLMFAGGAGITLRAAALDAVTRRLRLQAARAGVHTTMRQVRRFWATLDGPHGWSRFARPRIIRPDTDDR